MKQTTPKISIITVVYNDAEGFLITARSLLNQDYDNIEWIVIDGQSKDGTGEYIKNLAPAIANFTIEKDAGIYDAMNKGIDLVTGDWVIFLNANDIFYENSTVSKLVANINADDDILYADALRREDGTIQKYQPDDKFYLGMVFDHQASLVKADIYKAFKYDVTLNISADLNFFSNARVKGYNFRKIPKLICCDKPYETGASADFFSFTRQSEKIQVLQRHFDNKLFKKTLLAQYEHAHKTQAMSLETLNKLQQLLETP